MAPTSTTARDDYSYQDGPLSPTLSTRSTRSFLDEDPYPDGDIKRRSHSSVSQHGYQQPMKESGNSDLLAKLERLLNDKASEIHLAGQLGAALLQQQQELETRIRELAEIQMSFADTPNEQRRARLSNGREGSSASDSDGEKDIGEETRRRLEELENDLKRWDESNQAMYATVGTAAAQGVPALDATPSTPQRTRATASALPVDPETQFRRQRASSLSRDDGSSQQLAASASTSSNMSGSANADPSASRRARNNAQHRNNDIELATEIGQSLLSEVRRLQALLAEKEEYLKEVQKERDAVEVELENQANGRRGVEESVERYKEENWNLEVASQELRAALADSQSSLQKAEHERTRALRDLATTREQLDLQKSDCEKLTNQLESLRAKHETDMATMRKHTAGLQRDKSDLASTLEGLKAELAMKARGIKRAGSQTGIDDLDRQLADDAARNIDDDMVDEDEDIFRGASRRKTGDGFPPASPGDLFSEFGDDDASIHGSPIVAFQRGQSENSLRSGLAHAQRQIATLRSTLAREKAAKMEMRRQLADAGGQTAWDEDDESESGGSSAQHTPARNGRTSARIRGSARSSARGRGSAARRRGAAAIGVPSRLGREVGSGGDTSIESIDEEEIVDSFEGIGQRGGEADNASLFEHHFPGSGSTNGSGVDNDGISEGGFDSPTARHDFSAGKRSNRNSVHSFEMDPAFATNHFSDEESIRSRSGADGESPSLGDNRRSTLADLMPSGRPASIASSTISRGRPASGIFSAFNIREVQNGELQESSASPIPQVASPVIPMTDVSTMTDFPAPPLPEPVIIMAPPPPPPAMADVSIQVTPEPITPPPVPVLVHVSTQMTPEPVAVVPVPEIVMADFALQTEPEPKVETKEMATETDAPAPAPELLHVGTATEEVAPPATIEVQTQTEPLPVPEPVIVHVPAPAPAPAPMAAVGNMEDRALQSQPSLSSLSLGKLSSFFGAKVAPVDTSARDDEDVTLSLSKPLVDADVDSEGTDRGRDTETETEGEFEDARDSIGVVSPSPTHSRSTSMNDFQSVISGRSGFLTATAGEDSESDVEMLASPAKRFKPNRSRPTSSVVQHESPKQTVATFEIGIQTDEWKPEPIYIEVERTPVAPAVSTMSAPLADVSPSSAVLQPLNTARRDSINTFGRAESPDALDEAAATASAYLGASTASTVKPATLPERAMSPGDESIRPDSVMSSFSQVTTDAASLPPQSAVDKGKSVAPSAPAQETIMGPPPTPSRKSSKATRSANTSPRKSATSMASFSSLRQPPPRPTSPPPPDLLFRAQSPIFDEDYSTRHRSNGFLAPSMAVSRSQGSNGSASMGPPLSRSSLANMRVRAQSSTEFSTPKNATPIRSKSSSRTMDARTSSARTSMSDLSMRSDMSRRQSIASDRTSDGGFDTAPLPAMHSGTDSTDPEVIHAITQTMIGEFLHKYTRRAIGKGISEKRHKRFFWVHPYTKTLYWSSSDPGAATTNQSSAKSVFIEGVRQVVDPNPNPPGLYQGSIIVQTPNREIQITAGTRERHDMWFNAIKYLLARPDVQPGSTISARTASSPQTQRTRKSTPYDNSDTPVSRIYNLNGSQSDSRLTPKPSRGSRISLGGLGSRGQSNSTAKRSGTVAQEYQSRTMFGSPRSVRTFDYLGAGANESVEVVDRNEIPNDYDLMADDEHWEGLENVRACCGGKHDVGSLGRKHGHGQSHRRHSRTRSSISDADSIATPLQTPTTGHSSKRANQIRSKSAATLKNASNASARRDASAATSKSTSPRRKPAPSMLEPSMPLAPLTLNTGFVQNRF